MASGLIIASVANGQDGKSFVITLNGVAVGQLSFWLNRVPSATGAVPASYTGSNSYTVAVPYPALWYVWAADGNGLTEEPVAVEVGPTDGQDLSDLGKALRDLLWDNKLGLEIPLRHRDPNWTLKQVVFGSGYDLEDYPSILVMRPVRRSEYIAAPYVRQHTFSVMIACVMLREDEQSDLPSMSEWMAMVDTVLSQPAYDHIVLPSGMIVDFGYIRQSQVTEEVVGDGQKFVCIGTLEWGGVGDTVDSGTLYPIGNT